MEKEENIEKQIAELNKKYGLPKFVGKRDSREYLKDSEDDYIIKQWVISLEKNRANEICVIITIHVDLIEDSEDSPVCYQMPLVAINDLAFLIEAFEKKDIGQWQF